MVTGTAVRADADGTEPMVKKAVTHSAIATKIILLCFIFNFSFVVLLNCINCNPVPRRNQEPSSRGALNSGLTSADSGLQLNLEIALHGVPAKVQPLRLIQPSRRCVETSDDVTKGDFTSTPGSRIWDLSPTRLGAPKIARARSTHCESPLRAGTTIRSFRRLSVRANLRFQFHKSA